MIFTLLSIFVFVSYIVLIAAISIGWWRLQRFDNTETLPEVKVSVIVAVRNEALNIGKLMDSLFSQDYPTHLYEIIIVNDHSEDQTLLLVEENMANQGSSFNFKLIALANTDGIGKKTAINAGIQSSTGDLIVITDADCTAGNQWISTLASFYALNKPEMILGPVQMADGGSFLGKLQSLEFISLISSAAGSCQAGFPILANGANIAFSRQAYETCGGFSGNQNYLSGDDMFMMMSIKRKSGAGSIRFLRSEAAIVNTPATKDFKSFVNQRMRWVSKSRGYTDPFLVSASILVFGVNSWLVLTAVSAFFFPAGLKLFIILYLAKSIVDLPLMLSFSRFQRSLPLMWLFPLMEMLNAVYTFFIGVAGNLGKFEWKGRKSSTNYIESPTSLGSE